MFSQWFSFKSGNHRNWSMLLIFRCCIEWWYWYIADPPQLHLRDWKAGMAVILPELVLQIHSSVVPWYSICLIFRYHLFFHFLLKSSKIHMKTNLVCFPFYSPSFSMQWLTIWSPSGLSLTLCPKGTPSSWSDIGLFSFLCSAVYCQCRDW